MRSGVATRSRVRVVASLAANRHCLARLDREDDCFERLPRPATVKRRHGVGLHPGQRAAVDEPALFECRFPQMHRLDLAEDRDGYTRDARELSTGLATLLFGDRGEVELLIHDARVLLAALLFA